jgi:alpha-D-ribose 1-methylphosphonate 5-triphosphate synthase subunit PhnG
MTDMSELRLSDRVERLSLLARASGAELADALATHWPNLRSRDLRAPEIGLVMARGRMGGDGAPFNLGEAAMSRAAVEIEGGARGFGQLLGRRLEEARAIAVLDALAERSPHDAARVERAILSPLRRRLAAERETRARETAATKVDFFTLVRGED